MATRDDTSKSRFPITVWPSTPLPEVDVEVWPVTPGRFGQLSWFPPADLLAPLPPEWVLRELVDADLDDDAAVVELLERRGIITSPYFDRAYVPQDLHERLAPPPDMAEQRRDDWWEGRNDGTVEDARWWLKTARAMARTWTYVQVGKDPVSPWDAEGFVTVAENDLWPQFTLALDAGLRPFRARAEFQRNLAGQHLMFGAPRVGLYSAACRQVFNLIVNDESARECEKCGRIFVHQIGGSTQGRYRSKGLKFCSVRCARAETQRQYRLRESAKRKGHGDA